MKKLLLLVMAFIFSMSLGFAQETDAVKNEEKVKNAGDKKEIRTKERTRKRDRKHKKAMKKEANKEMKKEKEGN